MICVLSPHSSIARASYLMNPTTTWAGSNTSTTYSILDKHLMPRNFTAHAR